MSESLPSPIQVRAIDHVTLVVSNLEASRSFYADLIGMDEVPRPAFDFEGLWFQIGSTLLHLIREHDKSGPAGYLGNIDRATSRSQHLAFRVDAAAQVGEVLKAKNVPLVSDVKRRPDGATQVFARDPDGHVIEFCSEES